MTFEQILVENNHEGVCTISMNRPEALNAITPEMLKELKAAFADAGAKTDVRVVIFTGEGRAFSAGVDLKALGGRPLEDGVVGDLLDKPARKALKAIQTIPKPVIARVNGFCFTGALELALACDLIVMDEKAKLGDTHAKFGLRPTWGMSQRLPHAVGLLKARELSFTARTFTGADALAMGLANYAVPAEQLDACISGLVKEILANSQESIAAYKVLYNVGASKHVRKGIKFESKSTFEISDTMERLADFL